MRMYLSGSDCLAHGVRLSRVEVISAYPITPNSLVLDTLSNMVDSGELDADSVNAESEIGAMNICAGATAAGLRSFTCTCAQGLAYMKEMLWMASGMALPVVVGDTSRAIGSPQTFSSDFSDTLSERDASFLQYYCENAQEALDSMIMAYKIGEDARILLPSMVVIEGFRLSHTYEQVDVPDQELVDRFLPRYNPKHAFIDPNYPIMQGGPALSTITFDGLKYQQFMAMEKAKEVIKEVCNEFADLFGRDYHGLTESYMIEDAELVVVGMGSVVGIIREMVDEYRQKGHKIGMLKLRCFRPFPKEEIRDCLENVKKILVLDRATSPGSGGITYLEVKAALQRTPAIISNCIIGSQDILQRDISVIFDMALDRDDEFTEWYKQEFKEDVLQLSGYDNYEKLVRSEKVDRQIEEGVDIQALGNPFCPGCGGLICAKLAFSVYDKNSFITASCGCLGVIPAAFPQTCMKVPSAFFSFSSAGGAASGVEVALKRMQMDMDIFLLGGDGGILDIGLQTLSGALERGHNITYLLYDNEAYMNTGVQRSGSTPYLARTKTTPSGKKERKKDIMKIVEAHENVYTATASPAYPQDLLRKLKKAKEHKGPSFIYAIAPCPTGWEYESALTIEIARLAVQTGFVVLYEYEDGKRTINRIPKKRKPVEEYLSKQGRFSHLSQEQILEIQRNVDKRFDKLINEAKGL
ncbi:MAG: thiamine pyrophosphate-dependent enzyme [Thermodesulfobacteriota bacterium]|nr:thiamine pyrophosphate-dependent enzyme [Thermodesulfobacteriota bacterium]